MLPILAVIAGVAASAFTTIQNTNKTEDNTYWYSYTGTTQSIQDRSNPENYTNPVAEEPNACEEGLNECAVQVKGVTGTAPDDISSLSITFNSTSGMPEGGANFQANATKN